MGVVRERRGLVRHVASRTEAVEEGYVMGGASSQGAGLPPGAWLGADSLRARAGSFQALPSPDFTGTQTGPAAAPAAGVTWSLQPQGPATSRLACRDRPPVLTPAALPPHLLPTRVAPRSKASPVVRRRPRENA